jgi:1-acyl-sn-glycerol-3-phosphate acyltransferase
MIISFIHTLLARLFLFIIMVLFFIPGLILFCMPKEWRYNSRFANWFTDLFYWTVLKGSLLKISFSGLENLPHEPAIFAANHQSSLDIPLVGVLARKTPHVWLARSELMKSWILRWILPRVAVVVDVNYPRKAVQGLLEVLEEVEGKNRHVMIFPEGGRYVDGELRDFFRGFVILAKKMDRPVVPVRIFGVNKVYPPHTFLLRNYPIKVVVGKPMRYQKDDTDETFKDRVVEWFVAQKE